MPSELDGTAEINSTYPHGIPGAGPVVVRTEEALIVLFVLLLWVAAIALFFNRWGKIRMLEPYQPKFQQQHRQSCAIVDPNPIQQRTYSKFNIHCAEYPVGHPSVCASGSPRPRQNSVFVGSSATLLPTGNEGPRRTKSAFDLQSLVLAECAVQDDSEEQEVDTLKTLRPPTESSKLLQHDRRTSACQFERNDLKSFQRERGMSICHSDRGDVIGRPVQRDRGMSVCQYDRMGVLPRALLKDRGMSVCHFDRTDVLARPLQRDRGSSVCHFDRMDVLARPSPCLGKSLLRERRVSVCNFLEREEELARGTSRDRRVSVSNLDRSDGPVKTVLRDQEGFCIAGKMETPSMRCLQRERNNSICHYDRPSCSKTPDVVLGYKATCV